MNVNASIENGWALKVCQFELNWKSSYLLLSMSRFSYFHQSQSSNTMKWRIIRQFLSIFMMSRFRVHRWFLVLDELWPSTLFWDNINNPSIKFNEKHHTNASIEVSKHQIDLETPNQNSQ